MISEKKWYKKLFYIKLRINGNAFKQSVNLDKKQFLSIFIRMTMQYNKFLNISKEINIEHKGISLPYITKRG